ncbi:DKNYY domain-containing protein [Epilithonimonas lactis]|nr:DKNYY domain-containing protein [Epilithonimonas lactis]
MMYKYRFLIYGFFILLFMLMFGLMSISLFSKDDPINYNTKTKDLNGVFSVYDGKVYALVPSNGHYEVKGADPASFKVIRGNYADNQIGYDNQHVYAGNIILKGLRPEGLKVLGNNYYTDGTTTYYCARNSENNEALSGVGFIIGLAGEGLGLGDKPQSYWYPFQKLAGGKTYQPKPGFAIAVNDEVAFFKGQEMKESNPKTIRPIKIHYWDRDVRNSNDYFTDGKKVYYQNDLLPLAYNDKICQIGIEGDMPSRSNYLINPQNGMVYVDGKPFDESKAPYRLLGMSLEHAYQALFVSKDALYFYNTETEEVERAGDNPFQDNQFREIAPDVFTSGNKIYFLKATESWARNRGLQSRTTHLLELKGVQAASLKKISHPDSQQGSVWQAGNRYFYFDDLGSSQLMVSSIYEIKDINALKSLASAGRVGPDAIRNLSRTNKITEAESETILKAKTDKNNEWYRSYWLIFGAVVLVYVISFLFRNVKVHPFLLKDDYLILNNLLFKKYKIEDIEKVVFRAVKSNPKMGGYSGTMRIDLKNGKSSRTTLFTTRMTFVSETETQVITYIRELQKILKAAGIESKFS